MTALRRISTIMSLAPIICFVLHSVAFLCRSSIQQGGIACIGFSIFYPETRTKIKKSYSSLIQDNLSDSNILPAVMGSATTRIAHDIHMAFIIHVKPITNKTDAIHKLRDA
jgi:hypothetical protein